MSEFERALIKLRLQRGRALKAEGGGYAFGSPPLGFRAEGGELVREPREQETIELACRLRRKGLNLRQIGLALSDAGHPSKAGWLMASDHRCAHAVPCGSCRNRLKDCVLGAGGDIVGPSDGGKNWVLPVIAVFDMLAYAAGTLLSYQTRFSRVQTVVNPNGNGVPPAGYVYLDLGAVAVALVCIGVATFVGFYYKTNDIRLALTASVWVTYVALLASFLNQTVASRLSTGTAQTLVLSLTGLVAAISGFYFRAKNVEARERVQA